MNQKDLVDRLDHLKEIKVYSDDKWWEPEVLAYSIAEIGELGTKVSAMCSRIVKEDDAAKLADALDDLRAELGHLAYHIYDSRYLRMVAELYVVSAGEERRSNTTASEPEKGSRSE